eukprot:4258102-Amphidinium_carterae.1
MTKLFNKYSTVEQLLSKEFEMILLTLACTAKGSTYNIERAHSRNLRRAKARAVATRIDLESLSLHHTAFAGPVHLLHEQGEQPKRGEKRGRPTLEDPAQVSQSKRCHGGGGAWRAFQVVQLGGRQFSAQDMKDLSVQYRSLSDEERQQYRSIGHAGMLESTVI